MDQNDIKDRVVGALQRTYPEWAGSSYGEVFDDALALIGWEAMTRLSSCGDWQALDALTCVSAALAGMEV
jgi:hypothetical protein